MCSDKLIVVMNRFQAKTVFICSSSFSADMLAQTLQEIQIRIRASKERLPALQSELEISKIQSESMCQYLKGLRWSDLFELSDRVVRKMVVCRLISRIYVFLRV